MLGSLLTLPLRLGLRAAELLLRGTVELLDRAAGTAARGTEPSEDPVQSPAPGTPTAPPIATAPPAPAAPADPSTPAAPPAPAAPPTATAPPPSTAPADSSTRAAPPTAADPPAPLAPPPGAERPAHDLLAPVDVVQSVRKELDRLQTPDYDAPPEPVPVHVSEEAELVAEVAEPGAEDGAGAQVRVAEPWKGYGHLKAADVIDRLNGASAAELAAVELYELSGRNRKTVIAAARRQLAHRR